MRRRREVDAHRQLGLCAALVIAATACARDNPEFGLGGQGGGARASTGEDDSLGGSGQTTTLNGTGSTSNGGAMTTTQGTTDPTPESSTSDGALDSGDADDSGGDRCSVRACQPYTDGCSDGFKCTLFDAGGDGMFEKLACSEIAGSPDAELDPCSADVCGQDTCDAGLACAPAPGGGGVCRDLCHEVEDPCADAGSVCVEVLGPVGLCRASCMLLLQDCANDEGCFVEVASDEVSCAPESVDNGPGVACESYNDCAIGYQCMPSGVLGGCPDDAPSCCTVLCDSTTGDTCSVEETCLQVGGPTQDPAGVCVPN